MSTVDEILRAIRQLSAEERSHLQQELQRMQQDHPGATMPDGFWNKLEELEQGR
jgi:hypothetical protein